MSRRPQLPALRRLVRLACALATGIVLAAPLLFGPATTAFMRAIGVHAEHVCMCGMKPGTCGCPECERIESEKREAPPAHAVLKSACGDEDETPDFAPLPPAVLHAHLHGLLTPSSQAPGVVEVDRPGSFGRLRPPTPPPRTRV